MLSPLAARRVLGPLACGSGGAASSLADISHAWLMEEITGDRIDSVAGKDLTSVNNVGYTTGVHGNASTFVIASAQRLTRADTTLTMGAGVSQTWAFRWKDTTAGYTTGAIIARDNATTREWAIRTGNTVLQFLAFDGAGNPTTFDSFADYGDTFAKNAWHLGIVWFDASVPLLYYQVDGGTVRSKAVGTYIRAGTGPLEMGTSKYYYSADLALDEIYTWSRVLSVAERLTLVTKFYPTFS